MTRSGTEWNAARLYVVAADLRQQEDPTARRDLSIAANLYFQVGNVTEAVAALEAAGARALSGGDAPEAGRFLARAAWVERQASTRSCRPPRSPNLLSVEVDDRAALSPDAHVDRVAAHLAILHVPLIRDGQTDEHRDGLPAVRAVEAKLDQCVVAAR